MSDDGGIDPIKAALWERGIVASWYLYDHQLDIYDLLHSNRKPFLECSRRIGKTTSILCYVIEQLRANPGWVCRWVLPEKDQARSIVLPELENIQADCPDHLKFKYKTVGSVLVGPGGSKIYLYGVDKDRGKRLRGGAANIIVCDEYGFWSHPDILKRILLPQMLKARGKKQAIIASTPSEDLAHPYYIEREAAEIENRLLQKTIYADKSLTPDQIKEAMDDCGGEDSADWQREYLCNPVPNPEKLVIREYSEELNDVDDSYERPRFFDAYVAGDSGFDDNTALLFGYYDFLKDEIVIERELITRGETSKKIVAMAKSIECDLWGDKRPYLRTYDAGKQLLWDIMAEHDYAVSLPDKNDKFAAIHALRSRMGARKFKIKKNCVHTRRQLKVGMWKDEKHLDFQRSKELGHLDAIAAAVYFNRTVITGKNPIPQNFGRSRETHYISESSTPGRTESDLGSVF